MIKSLSSFISRNIVRIARHGLWPFWSDELYLLELWRIRMGTELNLQNPISFNEKLQWLKLYDRNPQYTIMADKYKARQFVVDRIGEQYLIPLIGVWNRPKEIDFDKLPDQFVLKCNHNSGVGMYICRNKNEIDRKRIIRELNKGIQENYYNYNREWCYKDIPRKIICEAYMEDEKDLDHRGLVDYKFFCFDGKPRFLYVSQGLENHKTARMCFLTLDWTFATYARSDYKEYENLPDKPSRYEEMVEIAKILSEGVPFLRVDLYEINGKIYFSEMTFFPCSGFIKWKNSVSDYEIGAMLTLPEKII